MDRSISLTSTSGRPAVIRTARARPSRSTGLHIRAFSKNENAAQIVRTGGPGQLNSKPIEQYRTTHVLVNDQHKMNSLYRPPPRRVTETFTLAFVTSEVGPYSRTGGLAEVMGALPVTLAGRGHRVWVISPLYASTRANFPEIRETGLRLDLSGTPATFHHAFRDGVDFIFIETSSFNEPGGLYADAEGKPYKDMQQRFRALSLGALEAPLHLTLGGKKLDDNVVFVANDWHSALIPVYMTAIYRPNGIYQNARTVLAIHNLAHQGVFSDASFQEIGLPETWYPLTEWVYREAKGGKGKETKVVNTLKAAIETSDRIVTVSPTYAQEIRTAAFGCGLEGMLTLRAFKLTGVLNGVGEDWNPATDRYLPVNYTSSNFVLGKRICKEDLITELGLKITADQPLLAFVGRLDRQKGADLLDGVVDTLVKRGGKGALLILGTGSPELEKFAQDLQEKHPDLVHVRIGFDVPLSHRIMASADILLMPSRFEPCGLAQMYAMRYGTLPIVHATGGLKDSVASFNPFGRVHTGNGWVFAGCTKENLAGAVANALETYFNHKQDFHGLRRRAMETDFTWRRSSEEWEQVFQWALHDPPHHPGLPPPQLF